MSDGARDQAEPNGVPNGTTVAEAARVLGISEGAVRKRVERGKLAADHTQDGRLIVYLEGRANAGHDATTTHDTTHDRPRLSRGDRYTRSLEDQIAYLRRQLAQEQEARTEERRRHDTLMAQLTQANAALAARIPELQSAPSDERESPVRPGPSDTPAPAPEEAQEAAEPPWDRAHRLQQELLMARQLLEDERSRPWWRRVFGR